MTSEKISRAKDPLSILFVVTRMDIGGVPEHLFTLVRGLRKKKHNVALVCNKILPRYADEFSRINVNVILLSLARLPNPLTDFKALLKLTRIMKSGRYDVVHTHMSKAVLLGGPAARFAKVPVVINTAHNIGWIALSNPLYRAFFWVYDKLLFGLTADAIVTVSEIVKKSIVRSRIAPEKKVYAIANGIDVPSIPKDVNVDSIKADLGVDNHFFVLTVARLVWFKGIDTLLLTAEIVAKTFPEVCFVIAGGGSMLGQLQTQAKALGIEKNVRFLGDREDIPSLLLASDLFVLPSVSEGMPISILEAMALAKAVVATDVGGVPELVVHGETGELVPKQSPQKLAVSIIQLVSDRTLLEQYGRAGKDRFNLLFSAKTMVDLTEQVYRNVLIQKL